MKKNSFIEGALIATIGIVIVKVIGLLYVIPFNAIIGEQGGALYGYAYNIYQLFLSVSSAGFPFAISKLTSEYIALDNKDAISVMYDISTKLILGISLIIFIILFIFSPQIAKLILGNSLNSNMYSDVSFVIRMVSFAILVVPFLSVTKGFLQGYKYITPTSISQIIEQIVRVIIILLGSYLALKVFSTDLKTAVGIAVSGAFFGGLVAFLYLNYKIKKSNLIKNKKNILDIKIDRKEIIKKLIKYSIPFILVSIIYNLYITVDMILISRTMNDILHYSTDVISSVVSVFTTWGTKLNNILLAVITGLTTSLIPNIVTSYTKNDMDDVNSKFNKAILYVLLLIVPATLFLSLLVNPVWTLFYGQSFYGPRVYKLFVFGALFGGFYTIVVNTLQGLNKYKLVIVSILTGLLINTILDVPCMLLMEQLNIEVSYGAIIAQIIGYSIAILMSLIVLNKKYNFNFKETIKNLPKLFLSWVIFALVILLLKLFIPTNLTGRLIQIPILCVYGIVSFGIYIIINFKMIQKLFDIKKGSKK